MSSKHKILDEAVGQIGRLRTERDAAVAALKQAEKERDEERSDRIALGQVCERWQNDYVALKARVAALETAGNELADLVANGWPEDHGRPHRALVEWRVLVGENGK